MTNHYKNGLSNVASTTFWGTEFGDMSPAKYHKYFNDFDTYLASDWSITTTEAGAGNASEAVTDYDGGALLITNDDADNDKDVFVLAGESFKFVAGKKLWFSARWMVSDATQSDAFMGLVIKTATDPVGTAPTDGVFFRKDDGDANLDFVVTKNSTATTSSALTTLSDATEVVTSFYYNGVDNIAVYVDDVLLDNVAVTNLPDDEILGVFFAIQNGEAVAKTMTIDYIDVAKER